LRGSGRDSGEVGEDERKWVRLRGSGRG